MDYVILTERTKVTGTPQEQSYWSQELGCFSRRDQATTFASFEAAQPTVKKLRKYIPFVSAIAK